MAKGQKYLIYLLVTNGFSCQMACFETQIRHEIIISRKFPGQVVGITFEDLSLAILIDLM